jgi:Kef-type K+ transport system membrane component KefB
MSDSHFTPLLIVVILAFIVPVFLSRFKKLRLPIVVGEILVGIIIGRSGFQLIPADEPTLDFLAEFGFVFLMFLSGMEIDFSSISTGTNKSEKSHKTRELGPLGLAMISFALTLILAFGVSFALVQTGLAQNLWMMGLMLSTTSLGVVVPVLKEKRLIGGKFGQTLLFAALIADFATMLLITVMIAILSSGLTFDILLVGLLFLVFFAIMRFGNFLSSQSWIHSLIKELSHATAQIKMRSAFAIMLVFVVLSETLGVEIILGAFLAGAIIALLKTFYDQEVIHQLESIGYGFLIPIFFIKVGLDINLKVIFESSSALLLVPILVIAALVVKILPALVFRLKFTWRESISAGALLSARLSLIIAAAAISLRLNIITETLNAAILVVAIITVTLAPILFTAIYKPKAELAKPPILIIGAGELGLQVATQLKDHLEKVMILDHDPLMVQRALKRGFDAVVIDITKNGDLTESILKNSQILVCTYADTDLNYQVCREARTTYGIPQVIAHVNTPADIYRFEQLGISTTNAALDYATLLVMMARNPTAYDLLTRTDDQKEIYEIVVESVSCIGKTLNQLNLPGDILVLALRRNGELLIPHGNTTIEDCDHLTLVSSLEWVDTGHRLFSELSD